MHTQINRKHKKEEGSQRAEIEERRAAEGGREEGGREETDEGRLQASGPACQTEGSAGVQACR